MVDIYEIKSILMNGRTNPVTLLRMLDILNDVPMNVNILEETEIWSPVFDLRAHEDEIVKTAATRLFRKWRVIYRRQKVQYSEVSTSGLPFNPASFENSGNPHEGLVSPDSHAVTESEEEEIIVVD